MSGTFLAAAVAPYGYILAVVGQVVPQLALGHRVPVVATGLARALEASFLKEAYRASVLDELRVRVHLLHFFMATVIILMALIGKFLTFNPQISCSNLLLLVFHLSFFPNVSI